MTEHVDMSAFIAARSDQLNADDLRGGPRTITITKVTGTGSSDQPVAVYYEGDEGKPFKPCKTVRRLMVAAWGPEAAKYAGRSMTLYCDPKVSFGGMEVGGIRVSHMSHLDQKKTLALLVTKGRKAPFTILPLENASSVKTKPSGNDYSAELEKLKSIAKPGNMDALGAAWKEIGAEARKALAAELAALKAACEEPAEDVPFDSDETVALNPSEIAFQRLKAAAEASETTDALDDALAEFEKHRAALSDEQQTSLEIAFDRARNRIAEGVE